jgi:hypothetical protein
MSGSRVRPEPYLNCERHNPDDTFRSRRRVGDGEARSDPVVVVDQKASGIPAWRKIQLPYLQRDITHIDKIAGKCHGTGGMGQEKE